MLPAKNLIKIIQTEFKHCIDFFEYFSLGFQKLKEKEFQITKENYFSAICTFKSNNK